MRKLIFLLLLVVLTILQANAQSTKLPPAVSMRKAEYFFDHDPGVGKGINLPITAVTVDSASITASISTSGLSAGFHVLYVRTLDNTGKWGLFNGRPFVISNPAPTITAVNAVEYFFDHDPGVGKGTAFSGTGSSTDSIVINTTVPTASLSSGFHVMYVRARDANGRWGDFVGRLIIVNTAVPAIVPVTAAEYFFDHDPGVGKGTALTGTAKGDSLMVTAAIPTGSLSAGLHVMYVRAKGSDGKWGVFVGRLFIINAATPNVVSVTAAEYFFDKDPGVGKATPFTGFTSQGDSLIANSSISTSGLSQGIHVMYVRAKDSNGRWGLFVGRLIIINPNTSAAVTVTGAEYFFDKDPGIGKGTPISGTSSGDSLNITKGNISLASVSNGIHVLYVRAKDSNGKWGLFKGGLFIISTITPNTEVVAMEYFFDNANPANGKGTPIVIPAPGDSVNVKTLLSASGLAPGAHTVSIRAEDNTGKWSLLDTKSFTISNCAQPVIAPFTASSPSIITTSATAYKVDTSICASGNLTLTAPTGYASYNWVNNTTKQSIGTSQSVTVTPGTYSIQVPALNSCPADTVTIVVSGAPTVTVNPGVKSVDDTLISSSATSNQWYFNGVVIPGATSQKYIAVTSGSYSVLVTNSCYPSPGVMSNSVTVTLPAGTTACSPPLIAPFAAASNVLDTTICSSGTVQLTAPVGHAAYNWVNTVTNQNIGTALSVTLSPGSYALLLPATTNCAADSVSITVSGVPTVAVKPAKLATNGDTLISSSATGNQWYLNGSIIPGATSQKYLATVSGNYNVVVKNSCYQQLGGASSVVIPVTVPTCGPPLITPFASGSSTLDTAVCNSASTTLTAPGGYSSYNWINNANNQSVGTSQSVTVAPGSYSLQVPATAYCVADTVSITISGTPSFKVKPGTNNIVDTLISSSPIGNQWYLNNAAIAGATNQTYVATVSGSYSVLVINSCYPSPGVSSASTVISLNTNTCFPPLIAPFKVASSAVDTVICSGATILFTAPVGYVAYNWVNTTNNQSIGINQSVTVAAGSYSLQVPAKGSCPADTVAIVVTNPTLTSISFTGLDTSYCANSSAAMLNGVPIGGTFSSPGTSSGVINGNSFNPSVAGAGAYQVVYKYVDSYSCSYADTLKTKVNALTPLSITGLNPSYCLNALASKLIPSPSGGVFSGTGITEDSIFTPSLAGAGIDTVTYAYIDGNGCTNIKAVYTVVYALPVVSYTGLNSFYCIKSTALALLTGKPGGGAFSGDTSLILPNLFSPSKAGVGTHIITYTYTDASTNCTNSYTDSTLIYVKPTISVTGLKSIYCLNSSPVGLVGTHPPEGGTAIFTGPGITDSIFSPDLAGLGNQSIVYTYTDSSGCFKNDTLTTVVQNPPAVSVLGLAASYCLNSDSVHLSGKPFGGTFSGSGTGVVIPSDSTFHPLLVKATGKYTITYNYTDTVNGCSNTVTDTTLLIAPPVVNILGTVNEYCSSQPASQIGGYPRGGTLAVSGGNYISVSSDSGKFTPSLPNGVDSASGLIVYTYTDPVTGCTNIYTDTIEIYAIPVIDFSGVPLCYSASAAPLLATAHPEGGIYTYTPGPGVTGSNEFDPSSLAPDTSYKVHYTYNIVAAGCSTSGNVTVQVYKPSVTLSGIKNLYCSDTSTQVFYGIPSGGIFSYSGSAFDTVGSGQLIFYPPLAGLSNSLSYTYIDTNSCAVTITQTIPVNPSPAKPVIFGPDSICSNDTLKLMATSSSSGVSYTWKDPNGKTYMQQSVTFINTDVLGNYSVMVANGSGCTNADTVFVKVQPAPPNPNAVASAATVCDFNAAPVYIIAESGYYYNWYISDTLLISDQHKDTLWIAVQGSYKLQLSYINNSPNSCVTYDTVTINGISQSPTITVQGYPLDSLLISSHANAYQWFVNNKRIIGATDSMLAVGYNGDYSVVAYYGNGCEESSQGFTVDRNDFVSINRISSQTDSTIILPSAYALASSNIIIKYDASSKNYYVEYTPVQDEELTITVTTMTGVILWEKDINAEKGVLSSTPVNLTGLASAMYILNAATSDQSQYRKIIVE